MAKHRFADIIHMVEHSDLSIRNTLEELGVPRSTFYRGCRRFQEDGPRGLELQPPQNKRYWNKIPESVREQVVDLALDHPDQSSTQLAWRFIDEQGYFLSESSVYRILKDHYQLEKPLACGTNYPRTGHLPASERRGQADDHRSDREGIYAQLRAEWSEKLLHLQRKIEELEFDASRYLDDLDVALVLMTRQDVFYKRMEFDQRTKLLQLFVKRMIINPEGEIIGHELHSPFAYLSALSDGQNGPEEDKTGSE